MHKISFWEIILVIGGFILIIFLLGYNSFTKSVEETRSMLPTPKPIAFTYSNADGDAECIHVTTPSSSTHVHFPLSVKGVINIDCWSLTNGSLGTLTVLNSRGQAVSTPYPITLTTKAASLYSFSTTINQSASPFTNTGSLLFRALDGAHLYQYPITF